MPFPAIVASTGGNSGGNATTHAVNLPSGIAEGDLLVALIAFDGNPTVTFPSGWSILCNNVNGTIVRLLSAYRVADGSEGASINVTSSASEGSAHISYRVTGHQGGAPIFPRTVNTGTSAAPDAPKLTNSVAAEMLYIAFCANDANVAVTGYPSGYSDGVNHRWANANGVGVAAATKNVSSQADDPPEFEMGSSEDWIGCVVGVRPTGYDGRAGFEDYFDGSALNARWVPVTGVDGEVVVSGGVASFKVTPNASGWAYAYLSSPIDLSRSQAVAVNLSKRGVGFAETVVSFVSGFQEPTGSMGGTPTLNALAMFRFLLGGASPSAIQVSYNNSANALQHWRASDNTWQSAGSTASNNRATEDSFYTAVLEIDGPGRRARLHVYGEDSATPGSYYSEQGNRLVELTDWVPLSATRSPNSCQCTLVIGRAATGTNTGAGVTGWIDFADVKLCDGELAHGWSNAKDGVGQSYSILKVYSYANSSGYWDMFLHEDRTGKAIAATGTGPKDAWGYYDNQLATHYVYYNSEPGSGGICVAYGSSPTGTLTKLVGNPVVGQTASSTTINVFVTRDPDKPSGERYQMLWTNFINATTVYELWHSYAPHPTGPWSAGTFVIGAGASGDFDSHGYTRPRALRDELGNWLVYVSAKAHLEAGSPFRISYLTGTELSGLVRTGVILVDKNVGPSANLTAGLSGTLVSVDDSSGFEVDAPVIVSQGGGSTSFSWSRVKSVPSSSQIELYNRLDGFTTVNPAKIAQLNHCNRIEIACVHQPSGFHGKTVMYVTPFGQFGDISGYDTSENTGVLVADAPTGPFAWAWTSNPPLPLADAEVSGRTSNENLALLSVSLPSLRVQQESFSFSDSLERIYSTVRSLAEDFSSSFVDAVNAVVSGGGAGSFARTLVEDFSGSFADLVARVAGYGRTDQEVFSFSDDAQRAYSGSRDAQESLGFSDALDRLAGYARTVSEAASFSDALDRLVAYSRTVQEALSFSDAASRALSASRSVQESFSFSDSVDRIAGYLRTLSEGFSFADAVNYSLGGATNFARTLVEDFSSGFADAVARVAGYLRTGQEALSFSETVSRIVGYSRVNQEAVPLSETVARGAGYGREAQEALSLSETVGRVAGYGREAQEALSLAEAVAKVAGYSRSAAENLAFSESVTRLAAYARAVPETFSFSDAVSYLSNVATAIARVAVSLFASFLSSSNGAAQVAVRKPRATIVVRTS